MPSALRGRRFPALEAKLNAKLAEFYTLHTLHPAAGRSLLQKVLQGKIVFTPVVGPDRAFYRAGVAGLRRRLLSWRRTRSTPTRVHTGGSLAGTPGPAADRADHQDFATGARRP